jgi:enoyl-CoA hydratase/carnithine racemase
MELVHYVPEGEVCSLVLDSQHNRNALSRQLVTELLDGLDRAEADSAVKVVVIRHAGPVFCSGADLSEAASADLQEAPQAMVRLQRRIAGLSKPVVARVSGAVRAGGIGIVGASDICMAATDATFALTEVRLGLAPAVISLTLLPRMHPRDASYTFLTGETFTGSDAVRYGLATRAVPADNLDAEVDRVCVALSKAHSQGLRETKQLLGNGLMTYLDARGDAMAQLSAHLFASEAAREAMVAFLSRKK